MRDSLCDPNQGQDRQQYSKRVVGAIVDVRRLMRTELQLPMHCRTSDVREIVDGLKVRLLKEK